MYEPTDADDLRTFVEELVAGGHLEGAALGIAKKVAAEGTDELSPKQKYVFEHYVIGSDNVMQRCARCASPIPWCEMYEAVHGFGDGMCGYCSHMSEKDN